MPDFRWMDDRLAKIKQEYSCSLLRIELPLISGNDGTFWGTIVLRKDVRNSPISHYTLKRVEHLRRSIVGTIERLGNSEEAA